jgi:hypothetical protein
VIWVGLYAVMAVRVTSSLSAASMRVIRLLARLSRPM